MPLAHSPTRIENLNTEILRTSPTNNMNNSPQLTLDDFVQSDMSWQLVKKRNRMSPSPTKPTDGRKSSRTNLKLNRHKKSFSTTC